MKEPVKFELGDGYAIYRAVGRVTLDEGIAMVTASIVAAREQKIKKLLVSVAGLTGFDSPTLGRRFLFATEWARAAEGVVCLAMVAEREMIDPNKFGITVARSEGLNVDVFTSEKTALAWLQAQ